MIDLHLENEAGQEPQPPINRRLISIDCRTSRHNEDDRYIAGSYGDRIVIRTKTVVEFSVKIDENDNHVLTRIFQAEFGLHEQGDEKRMVEIMLAQLKYPTETMIWAGDGRPCKSDGEWVTEIVLSERAKEMFAFITQYKPRLLEAFGL
jgi:hypothetical protein